MFQNMKNFLLYINIHIQALSLVYNLDHLYNFRSLNYTNGQGSLVTANGLVSLANMYERERERERERETETDRPDDTNER